MDTHHFNINRPVFLARRDAFYEVAVDSLYVPSSGSSTQERITIIEKIINLLKKSRENAFLACQSKKKSPRESDFLHFLNLISHNIESILLMIQNQAHMEEDESFMTQFLNTSPDQGLLQAKQFKRRAEDIRNGVWTVLRLAHAPYRNLQQESLRDLKPEEFQRYEKAYRSFKSEALERIREASSAT